MKFIWTTLGMSLSGTEDCRCPLCATSKEHFGCINDDYRTERKDRPGCVSHKNQTRSEFSKMNRPTLDEIRTHFLAIPPAADDADDAPPKLRSLDGDADRTALLKYNALKKKLDKMLLTPLQKEYLRGVAPHPPTW